MPTEMLSKGFESELIFEKSKPGKKGCHYPLSQEGERSLEENFPPHLLRQSPLALPEVSEPEIIRHFLNLSKKNFSVDTHFYPLGSCTMKHNPKINEELSGLPGFSQLHPYQPVETAQGILRLMYELGKYLEAITGMDRFSLQTAAGAHGELVGMMIARSYHEKRREHHRRKVLVPDSSHGTNPASAALYGFEVVVVRSNDRGRVDLMDLESKLDDSVACLMLTNPNTLGLFEDEIVKIATAVHRNGALLYYDGANMNALLGIARPGDMGFDIVHLNLHKTFSTPHGGGGPGAGPVGVKERLISFLPVPLVEKKGGHYFLREDLPDTIGKVKCFYGNVGMLIRAYAYIRALGPEGVKQVARDAILSANYLKKRLEGCFRLPYPESCMHEFVLSAELQKDRGVSAGDIAKRILDYGFYAPTVYFPLIVKEALMVEPTETESLDTLDRFVEAMTQINEESLNDPEYVKHAPHSLPIRRPDEVKAARNPILTYRALLESLGSP